MCGGLGAFGSDAQIYARALIVAHQWPARDFVQGAQTAATDIVAQRRAAMADARAGGSNGL